MSGNAQSDRAGRPAGTSDADLVRWLPGFASGHADVNGTSIHYVAGGEGTPLVLLPGWPQTWWEFNRMMPILASRYRVIAVDLRGMGGSSKPASGYDKKTMARDIYELVRHLGHDRVNIAGHDIGAMVAFSFAANQPEATLKLAILDITHPDDFFTELRMLPALGTFGARADAAHPPYTWWFALNQVPALPEKLLDGRFHIYQDWFFEYLLLDSASIGPRDRAVYAAAYANPDAIRAGNAWYQTFTQDVIDAKTYPKLKMPVLGLGGSTFGYELLQATLVPKAADVRIVRIENSGHFIPEEQPETASRHLIDFFD
jgi:pimeloyl-ACP methyl ester carboxylesterase